jgi:hypothetical protein
MRSFHPPDYGPVLAPLVSVDRCRPLDHGRPDVHVRAALTLATVEAAFAQTPLANRDMAECAISGVWLLHDFLDESHMISQGVETPTGSFWHAIMHRREGDFSNAKYWFRRVGAHEVLDELSQAAVEAPPEPAVFKVAQGVLSGGKLDPFAMVDACAAALRSGGSAADYCRRLQQLEWELLFDFSYRRAVAA